LLIYHFLGLLQCVRLSFVHHLKYLALDAGGLNYQPTCPPVLKQAVSRLPRTVQGQVSSCAIYFGDDGKSYPTEGGRRPLRKN
jgi:hypothetical protein